MLGWGGAIAAVPYEPGGFVDMCVSLSWLSLLLRAPEANEETAHRENESLACCGVCRNGSETDDKKVAQMRYAILTRIRLTTFASKHSGRHIGTKRKTPLRTSESLRR